MYYMEVMPSFTKYFMQPLLQYISIRRPTTSHVANNKNVYPRHLRNNDVEHEMGVHGPDHCGQCFLSDTLNCSYRVAVALQQLWGWWNYNECGGETKEIIMNVGEKRRKL